MKRVYAREIEADRNKRKQPRSAYNLRNEKALDPLAAIAKQFAADGLEVGSEKMNKRKTLNLVTDRAGLYALVLRGGKPRRYHRLTPASLARCKYIVRSRLAAPAAR